MTQPNTRLLALAAATLFAGCATQPLVLDALHPASTEAIEAYSSPARPTLLADETMRRTRELLKQREGQATAAESEAPVEQIYINRNGPEPSAGAAPRKDGHEHH